MELKVEELKKLNNGEHKGVIVDLEIRTTPYEYLDLVIESEGIRVKYGVPLKVNPVSRLGKLLVAFGGTLEINAVVKPKEILVGKPCTFMTMTSESGYANVVKDSVKPLVEQEAVK